MMTSGLTRQGRMLVTTFGLGTLRPAPGTWGSLPPVALAAVMMMAGAAAGAGPSEPSWWVYHLALLTTAKVFSLACIVWGDAAEAAFYKKDPSHVVADETAGQCIPLMFLPAASVTGCWRTAATLALAFVAFRLADILKLWPARGLQRMPGGWGILVDDLIAGLQALVVVQVVTRMVF